MDQENFVVFMQKSYTVFVFTCTFENKILALRPLIQSDSFKNSYTQYNMLYRMAYWKIKNERFLPRPCLSVRETQNGQLVTCLRNAKNVSKVSSETPSCKTQFCGATGHFQMQLNLRNGCFRPMQS
jgi:hypothetical protein